MLPILGALLGQGLNLVANAALVKGEDWIKEKTGVDLGAVAATGALSSADALTLQKYQSDERVQLQQIMLENNKLDGEIEKAYLLDVQSARGRDVSLQQAGHHNTRADVMVAADAIGLIACLVVLCIFRDKLPGEAVALISTIAGIFGLCLRDAHQFEFGSSRSSRDKDARIDNLMKGPQQ